MNGGLAKQVTSLRLSFTVNVMIMLTESGNDHRNDNNNKHGI